MQPCPAGGQGRAPPTRTQAPVPSTKKPTQATEPTSPTGGQKPKSMGTMNLQPVKRRPQTQYVKQNEKTEKYAADEGAR